VLPRGLFDYLPDGHRRPGRRRREPLRHREDRRPAAATSFDVNIGHIAKSQSTA
jgi:hypothetical protein